MNVLDLPNDIILIILSLLELRYIKSFVLSNKYMSSLKFSPNNYNQVLNYKCWMEKIKQVII